jgi:hypothetical protein
LKEIPQKKYSFCQDFDFSKFPPPPDKLLGTLIIVRFKVAEFGRVDPKRGWIPNQNILIIYKSGL